MEFRHHQLKNGLDIVAEVNPGAQSQAIGFFVRAGSRDESDQNWGVSHFLEHMMFKGTHQRSADEVNRELDEMGSQSNAYTSEEQTVYYAAILPEFQDPCVELLSDMMRPALRSEDFETEKQVIIEEIGMYDDQPPYGAHEQCMKTFFGDHHLGRSVLGTKESVTSLTPEIMRDYYKQRYSPGNMLLTVSGKLDFERLVSQVETLCGDWPQMTADRETPPAAPQQGVSVRHQESAAQQYILQVVAGPSATDSDRYAARLLASILGDESGSRFYWELIETGRAEYASIGVQEFQGAGIFMTYLCCAPEQAESNLAQIGTLLDRLHNDGVTPDELALAKSKASSRVVLHSERPANRLFAVGNNWIQRGTYHTVEQVVQKYQDITCEDIAAVLQRYDLRHGALATAGPLRELAGTSARPA